jgi:FdrA protein
LFYQPFEGSSNLGDNEMESKLKGLLQQGPVAINLGLQDFAASLETQGIEVLPVNWAPPAGGDPELMAILDELL